jgi:Kdo2-lipid IVA lauroyltransferase/acyltransferase
MNLTRSFPHDTPAQIKEKAKAFYWHLSTVFIEAVKNLSFSADALKTRLAYTNPELINELRAKGRNILLVGGHYGNWEWLITSLGIHFPSNVFGLGMPLSASFWQQKLTERRERFGLKVIHSKNYREHILKETNQPFILLMLADQSPGDSSKSYWMQFLNQPTAIPFGTEALANETDAAVVFLNLSITSPGFYSLTFELLSETPKTLTFGELTEAYTKRLETAIHSNPSLWMWSHKRWKREIPEDLNALRTLQENRFNQKYR